MSLFNRLKVWTFLEVAKSKDLNAEFDNIINHMSSTFISGVSSTVLQMQLQTDPGTVGNENLAITMADEITALRFAIARIIGLPYWYQSPALSIEQISSLLRLAVNIPDNRIVSGLTVSDSMLSNFLLADGTTNRVTLKAGGSNPDFIFFIKGDQYTASADVSFNGLALAPSTQNTATVNDANIVNDLYAGESDYAIPTEAIGAPITISAAGANIADKVGNFAAFKVVDGGITEYFFAFVSSATTIQNAFRGYFFDDTGAPVKRNNLNNGDTISVMGLAWMFMTTAGMLEVTYNNPVYSTTPPSSPSTGDFWFNLDTQVWNKFNGASFADANALFIGLSIQDTTKTVATRSVGLFAPYQQLSTFDVGVASSVEVASLQAYSSINVFGVPFNFGPELMAWDTPTNLDTGVTISPNSTYWLYLSEQGVPFISDQKPYNQDFDLLGWYHPYNSWRAVGSVTTDGSGNFLSAFNYGQIPAQFLTDNIPLTKLNPRVESLAAPVGAAPAKSYYPGSGSTGTQSTSSVVSYSSLGVGFNLETTGGPVFVGLIPDGSSDSLITTNGRFSIQMDSVEVGAPRSLGSGFPWMIINNVPAGVHNFDILIRAISGTFSVINLKFIGYEI